MILPALDQGAYQIQPQVCVGERLGGGKHNVDCVATKNNKKVFISLKWQQSGGTAEQKIPYEVMCLAKAIQENQKKNPNKDIKAYLVLGGTDGKRKKDSKGWTLRDFYINGGLNPYLHPNYTNLVEIIKTEDFIALANSKKL